MKDDSYSSSSHTKKNYLKSNLRELPYFRALLRAVESRFYDQLNFEEPILDLGCGDGLFGQSTFRQKITIGLDPKLKSLLEAHQTNIYHILINSMGSEIPLPDQSISTVISNSVLEHILQIDPVLEEIKRVCKIDALFVFCVPNENFTNQLSIGRLLEKLHMNWMAMQYRRFFNRISRHYHCDSPELWEKRLKKSGFKIERYWNYFSPDALAALELGHYFGVPYWLLKQLSGKWVIFPGFIERITYPLVKKYYFETPYQPLGAYTFFICKRI